MSGFGVLYRRLTRRERLWHWGAEYLEVGIGLGMILGALLGWILASGGVL